MRTWMLVISRLFAVSFGLIPACSAILKQILVQILIKRSGKKYVAATKYFDLKEFMLHSPTTIDNTPADVIPQNLQGRRDRLILLLMLWLAGLIIYWPSINMLSFLIQGDQGRDLYAIQNTLTGATPYRDYYYSYGPFIPYFYAFFFKILGPQLTSVLIGKICLNIFSGTFIFLSLSLFIQPWLAFLGATWFFAFFPDFQHAFGHTGGVTLILLIIYLNLRLIRSPSKQMAVAICLPTYLLLMVKINMGGAALLFSCFSLYAIHALSKKRGDKPNILAFSFMCLLSTVLAGGFSYYLFLKGVPLYQIKQYLPIASGYTQFGEGINLFNVISTTVMVLIPRIISGHFDDLNVLSTFPKHISGITAFFLFLLAVVHIAKKKQVTVLLADRTRVFLLASIIFSLFIFSHEYLSQGVVYQLIWTFPLMVLVIFIFLGMAFCTLPVFFKRCIAVILFLVIIGEIHGKYDFKKRSVTGILTYAPFDGLNVYSKNPQEWIDTVTTTTKFLQEHLRQDELFFALPYEPLFYYLMKRPSPVPELIFFDFLNISPEQESRIIRDLEAKKVNFVIMSNRRKTFEPKLGILGITYGHKIAAYIKDNFKEVSTIGDWKNHPTAIWFYGIKIYERIKP